MYHYRIRLKRIKTPVGLRGRLSLIFGLLILTAVLLSACNVSQESVSPTGAESVLPQPQKLPTRAISTATAVTERSPTETPIAESTESAETPEVDEEPTTERATPSSRRLPGAYVKIISAVLAESPGGRTLARIPAGARVGILEQSANGVWLKVQYQPDPEAEVQTGWVRVSNLAVFADLDNLTAGEEVVIDSGEEAEAEDEVASPEETLGSAIVLANRLNVRAGPGTDQAVVAALVSGEQVQLVGRTENSQWLKVQLGNGNSGWAAARWLKPDIEVESLPVSGTATTTVPKPTAAGGKIVFQNRNGGDIYIINANGSGLRRLTSGFDPAFSADGTRVAFTRFDEPPGLWVINADGSGERQLYTANRPRSPTWLPDGQAIIFEQNTGEFQCRNTPFGCYSDEQLRQEFGGNDCIDTPFGEYCITDFNLTTMFETGLLRYELANGAVRDLPTVGMPYAPKHHPRNEEIIYLNRDGLSTTKNAGNDPPNSLVQQSDLGPAVYSPDGEFIYTSRRSGDHWDIWRYRVDGSGPQALTAPPGIRDAAIHNVSPTISPDGRSILFLTNRRGKWEFWIMNRDGSNPRPFAPQALASIDFEYGFARERMVDWGS